MNKPKKKERERETGAGRVGEREKGGFKIAAR